MWNPSLAVETFYLFRKFCLMYEGSSFCSQLLLYFFILILYVIGR